MGCRAVTISRTFEIGEVAREQRRNGEETLICAALAAESLS